METAPTTGEIVLGDFDGWPVMMAWVSDVPHKETRQVERKWWQLSTWETVEVARETGWRVLMPGRGHGEYFLHGNYGPFKPRQWMALKSN
jgi:hypothetical protein